MIGGHTTASLRSAGRRPRYPNLLRAGSTFRLRVWLAFGLGLVLAWPNVSPTKPANAPVTEFSAARAMAHIQRFSREPRPHGSAAQSFVIADFAAVLSATGLDASVVEYAGMRNIEGHAPGADHTGGVWLVAHSDSVRQAPGAADDGLGLGVVLETARALSLEQVPADLHVLITDGEEHGLLGAKAHLQTAVDDHRLILNIEARGTSGPAYMFQTAGPTPTIVEALARSGCPAQATSLARAVYDVLPNDTDFTVFRRRGWWGYDFAIIAGAWRYHTPADTIENLDAGSVQQVGDCVLALAKIWLDRGDWTAAAPDQVQADRDALAREVAYAQVLGRTVAAPDWAVRGFGLALLGGAALARRKAGRAGVGAWMVVPILTFAVGFGLNFVPFMLAETRWNRPAEIADPLGFYLIAYGVGIAGAMALLSAAGRASGAEANDGWSLATATFAGFAALFWPVGGYVLLPGGFAALALALGYPMTATFCAMIAGLLVGPVLVALPVALTTRMMPVLCVVPWLLVGFLFPPASFRRGL